MIEFFEHTADVGFRVQAADRAELYREAARGLFQVVVENLEDVRPLEHRQITLSGTDDEYLLFDWLTELLYLHGTQHMVFSRFLVKFTITGLVADIEGEQIDPKRHHLLQEVKAVTYHQFQVQPTPNEWNATVILDI